MLNVSIINTFAIGTDELDEAERFIEKQGFLLKDVDSVERTTDGFKFSMRYLPNGEISYVTYEKEIDGFKLIITEGEVSNEILYKNNGYVYLDGTRNELLEQSYANSNVVSNYAVIAVSNYQNIEDVPGYGGYWQYQSFSSGSALGPVAVGLSATLTVGVLSRMIAGAYALPASLAFLFNPLSLDAINFFVVAGLTSAILNVYNSREYMHNPQTLQYLYKVNTSGAISGNYLSNNATFYRLESYN